MATYNFTQKILVKHFLHSKIMLTCILCIFLDILLKLSILMFTICLFLHTLQVPHCNLDFEERDKWKLYIYLFCVCLVINIIPHVLLSLTFTELGMFLLTLTSNIQTTKLILHQLLEAILCKSWHIMAPCCLLRETHCVPQVAGATRS